MIEDELRRAMEAGTREVSPSRERLFKAQLEASRRRRRRDTVAAAISGSALSLLAVFAFFNMNPPTAAENQTVGLAAQVETEVTVAPSKISSGRPKTLVAASSAGRLVLIDPQHGNTTKNLLTLKHPANASKGGLAGTVALDGKGNVFFDAHMANACAPEIRVISTAGGSARKVTSGTLPVLSPDDGKLAFVRDNGCKNISIAVRDLVTGSERVLVTGSAEKVASLSWSPDGNQLLADVRYRSQGSRLSIFPTGSQSKFESGRAVSPPSTSPPGTVWEFGSFLPDGRIFLSERCCVTARQSLNKASRMIVVDPDDPNATSVIALGIASKTHTGMATDQTGDHLLYLSGTDLMASDNGARPNVLARGLLGATWR